MPPLTVLTPQAVLVTAVVALTASSNPAHGIEPTDLFCGSTSPVQFLVANRAPINGGLIPTDTTPVAQKSLFECKQKLEDNAVQSPPPSTSVTKTMLGPVQTRDIGTATIKYSNPAVRLVQTAPGIVELGGGEVLVSASENTIVQANGTIVAIGPGAMALINYANGTVKVLNAREEKSDSIQVASSNNAIKIGVGEQVLAAKNTKSLAASKVSLWGAYRSSGLMRSLVRSAGENDQQLSNRLIKMAAVLLVARSIY